MYIYFVFFTTVEFIMAQSPFQVRGFVTFLLLEVFVIFTIVQGCIVNFVPCIAHAVFLALTFVFFVLFVDLSKRYELRKREEAIPYHKFAENQFESDYRQERNYQRERGWLS